MKIQEFDRMEDLEDYLVSDEVADSYIDADEEIVNSEEFGDKDFVVVYEPIYKITLGGKTYYAVEGIYCAWEEEDNANLPQWDISLVFDDVEDPENLDLGSFAYYEQGSPASAILNYHHALLRSAMVEGGKE